MSTFLSTTGDENGNLVFWAKFCHRQPFSALLTSVCVLGIHSFKGRQEMGHREHRVFLQVTIFLKTYRNLTATSLQMKKNLTACFITFTQKEFVIPRSETFPFSGKELCPGMSLCQVSHPLLISLILTYVEWDSHALHCPAKELKLPPDGENLLWASSSCVFYTGCNLRELKTPGTQTQCFQQEELFKCYFFSFPMLFSLSFPRLFFLSFSHRAGSVSSLVVIPDTDSSEEMWCSLLRELLHLQTLLTRGENPCQGKETFFFQNFLHRSQQWDEMMAQIITPCCWPPGSFSSCQSLVPLQVWGFCLLWMKCWVMRLGQNFLSKALLSLPFFPSWCASELALKHPHNTGNERKKMSFWERTGFIYALHIKTSSTQKIFRQIFKINILGFLKDWFTSVTQDIMDLAWFFSVLWNKLGLCSNNIMISHLAA